jgi:hypothetical protein
MQNFMEIRPVRAKFRAEIQMDGQTEKYHKANIHFPPCLQSAEK